MSNDRYIDRLRMPADAEGALVKAVPDQVVRDIVSDHYRRAAPAAPAPKSLVDLLVERFGPGES